ncbi:MAG TPA: hypothetical protein PLP05_06965 [Sedimentisphaerales bacterium]|nr:hypothetical protein [Sedimentisphaerales bacterium]
MRKQINFAVALVMAFGCFCSTALALDFMGPPSAELKKGQISLGADYSDTRMNLGLDHGVINESLYQHGALASSTTSTVSSFTLKRLKMHKLYANIGYGITDNWETFIRLGGMNTEFSGNFFPGSTGSQSRNFNGDTGFAIGFGTKVTFYEKDKLKLGALFQMSWASSHATASGVDYRESVDLDIVEMQIALGATYQLTEKIAIYGGPFWHFINFNDSDLHGFRSHETDPSQSERKTCYSTYDIDDESNFGGYIGAQYEVFKDTFYCIEYQHTGSADALAMSIRWKF